MSVIAAKARQWLPGGLSGLLIRQPWAQSLGQRRQALFPHIDWKHLVPLDLVRIVIQLLWLILVRQQPRPNKHRLRSLVRATWARYVRFRGWLGTLIIDENNAGSVRRRAEAVARRSFWDGRLVYYTSLVFCALIVVLCITTPFSLLTQFLFVIILWAAAMLVRRVPGHLATMMLIVFSITASSRYLWWRFNYTLNWDDSLDLALGLGLLAAEVYAWAVLLLGYFQTAWPLNREPVDLPADTADWPSVDVYIPTYNEPLSVVRPTVYAAQALDWPADKINVYLLDDGRRDEFRVFAEEAGVNYMTRDDNAHAKAGNLNRAMQYTDGEFIAIFDCDHIPTRSFLQTTMGLFLQDQKLALVQTPHHFFSPDPFERNLGNFGKVPNENELFYGLVQDGNDLWDATFFCGSCAVIRREPLMEIGGIAVETVTEDAHTSLRLHRLGYRSAYLSQPQAAGLATESLSAHVGQRIRWARGMAQIFRIDNPFKGKGLSLPQRLCYSNAMLHFLYGIPRLVFLTAPLAFLLFGSYIIYASALSLTLYVLPHILHSNLANSRIQGKYRYSFWAEVYETALAWYIARPTTVALINPDKGSFNVTAKGGLVEKEHFDWLISKPYLLLVFLNIAGFIAGIVRLFFGDPDEIQTVVITMLWTTYNLTMLGAAMAVAAEARQVRVTHRVGLEVPIALHMESGHCIRATTIDYSEGGLGVSMPREDMLARGDKLDISLKHGMREYVFPARVSNVFGTHVGLRFDELTEQQEKDLVYCTFARADAWVDRNKGRERDRPLHSLAYMASMGLEGYARLFRHLLSAVPPVLVLFDAVSDFLRWMAPRKPIQPEAA